MPAMSRNVLRKMWSSVRSRYGFSQSCFQVFTRSPAREMLKFMLPMLRLHISGFASSGAASRSSSVMVRPAAGGDVHHRIGALLDHRQEAHEHRGVRRRLAGVRIARVQMDDGGAGLGGLDGGAGDLLRRDRQVVRHAGRVDGARDGATDDDLACHGVSSRFVVRVQSAPRRGSGPEERAEVTGRRWLAICGRGGPRSSAG